MWNREKLFSGAVPAPLESGAQERDKGKENGRWDEEWGKRWTVEMRSKGGARSTGRRMCGRVGGPKCACEGVRNVSPCLIKSHEIISPPLFINYLLLIATGLQLLHLPIFMVPISGKLTWLDHVLNEFLYFNWSSLIWFIVALIIV